MSLPQQFAIQPVRKLSITLLMTSLLGLVGCNRPPTDTVPAAPAPAAGGSVDETAASAATATDGTAEVPGDSRPQDGDPPDDPNGGSGQVEIPPPGTVPAPQIQPVNYKEMLSLPAPEGLINIGKKYNIWIDKANKEVLFDGEICMREGALELLACEVGTKTHESVIKSYARPSIIHAALLAIGAEQGAPVVYRPQYKPATGAEIDLVVKWIDEEGKDHEVAGQQFVQDARTGEALKFPWVFAGSGFWKDDFTGETVYIGDSSGDFICVSNFPSATLDLPIESSAENEVLLYQAFTENIPPLKTPVRVFLKPRMTGTDGGANAEPKDEPKEGGQDGEPPEDVDGKSDPGEDES